MSWEREEEKRKSVYFETKREREYCKNLVNERYKNREKEKIEREWEKGGERESEKEG